MDAIVGFGLLGRLVLKAEVWMLRRRRVHPTVPTSLSANSL